MLNSKKLDIAKLVKENNRFLAKANEKRSWRAYEKSLANERVTNTRLISELSKRHEIKDLVDDGQKWTYEEYKRAQSNFSTRNEY